MTIKWVDTHCHLFSLKAQETVSDELLQSMSLELSFAVTIGTTKEDNPIIVEKIQHISNLFGTVGIHPGHVKDWSHELSQEIKNWYMQNKKIVAIGEIGLDYNYPNYDEKEQKKVFTAQLEIAQELNAPVVIHARDSIFDVLEILKEYPSLKKVVFHCFTGNIKEAEAVLSQGYHMSFTGVITFPKSDELRQIVTLVPLNRIMVETDSPYLTPVPFRGKNNSPLYVSYVGELVAQLYHKDTKEMASITEENAKSFFNIF